MLALGEDPRVDGEIGQITPERDSESFSSVPGAPKKINARAPAKRDLKPKRLSYNDADQAMGTSEFSSQASGLSQDVYELLEARVNTNEGTWVQCDHPSCGKWRYLADIIDPTELPEKWYCSMNQDPDHNSCEAAEEDIPLDELEEVKYFVGSIVWAKVDTYPWWPAMIDDDPNTGTYQWQTQPGGLPTHYHVTFLDKKVTRAWVRDSHCKPFLRSVDVNTGPKNKVPGLYKRMFNAAVETAHEAVKLPVAARIKKYCFVNCYHGKLNCSQIPKGTTMADLF